LISLRNIERIKSSCAAAMRVLLLTQARRATFFLPPALSRYASFFTRVANPTP